MQKMIHYTAPKKPTNQRNPQIDALRGFAAASVMFYHFTCWFDQGTIDGILMLDNFIVTPLVVFPYGALGVPLFFMISGYVMYASAKRYSTSTAFMYGRFSRLYPIYWFSLALASACYLYSNSRTDTYAPEWPTLLANITMFQKGLGFADVNGAYWTLYIELQFYLLVAFLIAIKQLKLLPWIMFWCVIGNSIATEFDCWDWVPGLWRIRSGIPLINYVSYFAVGIWISIWNERTLCALEKFASLGICVGLINGPYSPIACAVLTGIFYLACFQKLKFIDHPICTWLGAISYSLYLCHGPIGYSILNLFQNEFNINALIVFTILASLGASTVLHFYVETPAYTKLRAIIPSENKDLKGEPSV